MNCSHTQSHSLYSPLQNGWCLDGELFRLKCFECDMMPSNLDAFSIPFGEDFHSDDDDEEKSGDSKTDEEDED